MNKISERLTIEEHNGRQIIVVNYDGLKEMEMIELVNHHLTLTLETKLPFLANYRNTYVTPRYMIYGQKFVASTKGVIEKGAFLGVDPIKAWILKGVVIMHGVNYQAFDTADKAIEFLTSTD